MQGPFAVDLHRTGLVVRKLPQGVDPGGAFHGFVFDPLSRHPDRQLIAVDVEYFHTNCKAEI